MPQEGDMVQDARNQLTLILSFFPRVDARLSTVLAIDTAIVATLSAAVPSAMQLTVVPVLAAVVTAILLALSLLHLYKAGFPDTKGGHSSLVYFRDIAARNEARFLEDYKALSPEAMQTDLLAQVWRNSEILTMKYQHLKQAFIFMACSLLPWALTLATFTFAKQGLHLTIQP